jgi:uncharacterized membrane protein (UPF0127 family)
MQLFSFPCDFLAVAFTIVLISIILSVIYVTFIPKLKTFNSKRYSRSAVELVDVSGETLSVIEVQIADTPEELYLGLSETDSLGRKEGMLFVHESSNVRAYVMRDMAFPLDIIFISADGRVTEIQQADLPPDGASDADLERYHGRGKYVLEIPMGTAEEVGLSKGDRVVIPSSVRSNPYLNIFPQQIW